MKVFSFYVYILSNHKFSVFYTGLTNNLVRRCMEHKQKNTKGFTQKYNVDELMYFELFDRVEDAIYREKQIKSYSRAKKTSLIDRLNPDHHNLFEDGKIKI
jgi:putative endonuclease